MPASPSIFHWAVGGIVLVLVVWVGLGLVLDHLPWKLLDTSQPEKKKAAAGLLLALGIVGYLVVRDLIAFAWMGLRYLLGMEFENL
ncbi:hypothetical protein [Nitrospina watsonii]|uniref:DUF1146 domain-containing protein n=1 Tax=Nitrospina watsonii TaxID=1323948 RepID=A0ABM9HE89_9BACT|nr:hypothetical protein [Nitrospina watsonii]CAI2718563.1 conserved protein of unknown function [Nitrospina watsonii]